MGKTFTVDPITHQTKKNNGERELYIVRDGHPAIVTRELFNDVQSILDKNKEHFKITSKPYQKIESEYTHFIYCPYCGHFYFSKKNRHPELISPTVKRMFYCSSNRTRKLCKESESVYQDELVCQGQIEDIQKCPFIEYGSSIFFDLINLFWS